jgi:hypothetical protein
MRWLLLAARIKETELLPSVIVLLFPAAAPFAPLPKKVLFQPKELVIPAPHPIAVLYLPVVLFLNAHKATAVFFNPDVLKHMLAIPIAVL